MCGIAGFWAPFARFDHAEQILERMAGEIRYRGPDDFGCWYGGASGIGLAHRRLSIQDLSALGHQPMMSSSGRYMIVFNGEIYNFRTLRAELERKGCTFKGHSDTEVILALVETKGVDAALREMVGMFAFALWDSQLNELYLARDRFGEKPLYYGLVDGVLLFASELKALKVHPSFRGEIDRDVLATYLRFNYVPTPYCIYKGFNKVVPGTFIRFKMDALSEPRVETYWDIQGVARQPREFNDKADANNVIVSLDKLLSETIADKMISDVPLGAFLSGGVDSSTIVALMQNQSDRPIKTFSIGFHEEGFNEAVYAREVANYLKTDHTELYVTSKMAQAVISELPKIYDEPFADASQIPTYLVSKLARQHVTVALSGDGGDELFGGYNRYVWAGRIWSKASGIPFSARKALQVVLRGIPVERWDALARLAKPLLPRRLCPTLLGDKIHKLAGILAVKDRQAVYRYLISQAKNPASLVRDSRELPTQLDEQQLWDTVSDFWEQMMLLDQITYMRDDILTKVDRAAMAVSLETRTPFLDHRIAEFAWSIPLQYKVNKGQGKWILRQVLYRHVPKELIERPKAGFSVPIAQWLRGDLRGWAESLLCEDSLTVAGCWHVPAVRAKWKEHLSGQRNWWYEIWGVLMFQAWLFSVHKS